MNDKINEQKAISEVFLKCEQKKDELRLQNSINHLIRTERESKISRMNASVDMTISDLKDKNSLFNSHYF